MKCIYKHKNYPDLEFKSAQELLDFLKTRDPYYVGTLEKPINIENISNLKQALQLIAAGSFNSETLNLFLGRLIDSSENVPIKVDPNIAGAGRYVRFADETNILFSEKSPTAATIIHEAVHHYVDKSLSIRDLIDLKEAFTVFKNKYGDDSYGFKNEHEFLAELLANREFYEKIKYFKLTKEDFTPKEKGIINRLIRVIDSILKNLFIENYNYEDSFVDNVTNRYFQMFLNGGGVTSPILFSPKELKNFQYAEYNAEKLFSTAVRNNDTKDYEENGKSYESVTGKVIPKFQTKPYTATDTPGQRLAKNLWKDTDPAVAKLVDELSITPIDMDTAIALEDKRHSMSMAKGTIFHKIIHLHFSNDENAREELSQLYIEHRILPSEFEWLNTKTIQNIIQKTGTDFYEKAPLDRIHTEKTFKSDILGWAGTADLLIDHGDDVYSIFDLKTGRRFNRLFENSFLKYGRTSTADIFDNPRNRAKLQLMLYSFIIKTENEKARFRNLELIHIQDRWNIDEHDALRHVNVPAFLEIIEGTIKNEEPELYAKLKQLPHFKSLFNASSYTTVSSSEFEDTHPNADAAMILKIKIQELQSLIMYDRDIVNNVIKDDGGSRKRLKKIEQLTSRILKLRKDSEMDYKSWDTDMG